MSYFVVVEPVLEEPEEDFDLWLPLPLLCEPLLCELLLCELEDFPEVLDFAALEDGAAAGSSAASAAPANPKLNKAEVINMADLFMDAPTVVVTVHCRIQGKNEFHPT